MRHEFEFRDMKIYKNIHVKALLINNIINATSLQFLETIIILADQMILSCLDEHFRFSAALIVSLQS